MTTEPPLEDRVDRPTPPDRTAPRGRGLLGLLVLVIALAVAGWWGYGQVVAWRHFNAAGAALAREDPQGAREHLEACIAAWPSSGEVRFLAARAARREGRWSDAGRRLDEAAERGWVAEAIDLERALLRAQTGELHEVEEHLRFCLTNDHPDSVLILEALTPLYVQRLNLHWARYCIDQWLQRHPESVQAWRYRGVLAEKNQERPAAVEAYRKVLELGPARPADRENLGRSLLAINQPAEARAVLEELHRDAPDDLKGRRLLAQCYHGLGLTDDARRLLAGILQVAPDDAEALHLRGRLELDASRPEAAADFLRRAARLQPYDREVLYTWLRCLRAVGPAEEMRRCEERLKQVEADLVRVRQLIKEVLARAEDPEPRRQIGEIYLRNGQEEEGLRWLHSALAARPDHAAAHLSLARYFESRGDLNRASLHSQAARTKQPGSR
jgi:tetratricopeptide (TPR) repeat protein